MHESLHVRDTSSLDEVECPHYVGLHVRARRMVRERNRDQGGEMIDHLDALHRSLNAVGIADVACEEVDGFPHLGWRRVEPTALPEGVVKGEGPHVVTGPHQRLGEM